jgi:hypothetical protein
MNQENLKFLQDRLFYLGTEKRLFPELEKNMIEGKPEFTLAFSNHYDKDKLSANLHFRKSDNSEMYFLNRYDAVLQKPAQEGKSQTFYLENGKGVTMKEAYNLLDGRAVNKDLKNKEGVAYNAWVKLDFNNKDENGQSKLLQYHKNYGYDLNQELLKLPIFPMPEDSLKQLVSSLERGNMQHVKLPEGAGAPIFIAANPQFKTLDVFNENGRLLSKDEKKDLYIIAELRKSEAFDKGLPNNAASLEKEPAQSTEQKQDKAQKTQSVNQHAEKKSSLKPLKKEKSESLLPKKRTGQKKGMSI